MQLWTVQAALSPLWPVCLSFYCFHILIGQLPSSASMISQELRLSSISESSSWFFLCISRLLICFLDFLDGLTISLLPSMIHHPGTCRCSAEAANFHLFRLLRSTDDEIPSVFAVLHFFTVWFLIDLTIWIQIQRHCFQWRILITSIFRLKSTNLQIIACFYSHFYSVSRYSEMFRAAQIFPVLFQRFGGSWGVSDDLDLTQQWIWWPHIIRVKLCESLILRRDDSRLLLCSGLSSLHLINSID